MTARATHTLGGLSAGLIVFVVTVLPVLLIGFATASGSFGDLSEVELLFGGLLLAVVVGIVAGWLMIRALDRTAAERRSPLDAWAAFFVGLALFIFLITLIPAIILLGLFPDENQSIDTRVGWIYVVWIGGYAVAALAGALIGRQFLGRGRVAE